MVAVLRPVLTVAAGFALEVGCFIRDAMTSKYKVPCRSRSLSFAGLRKF
jgi:hypothetical protein